MIAASSSERTNNVVGIPFRAATVAKANPKFPPPMTATRTGYGGGELVIMYSMVDDVVRDISFRDTNADAVTCRCCRVSNEKHLVDCGIIPIISTNQLILHRKLIDILAIVTRFELLQSMYVLLLWCMFGKCRSVEV